MGNETIFLLVKSDFLCYLCLYYPYAARVYATSEGAAAGQAGSITGREVTDGREVASPGTSSATEAPAAGSIGGAFVGNFSYCLDFHYFVFSFLSRWKL